MKIVKVWRCLFPLSFFLTISLMINQNITVLLISNIGMKSV